MSSKYLGIVFICGVFLILGTLSLNQMIVYTPDSARYLVWANSLTKMEGFKDATNPETSKYVVHAPLYPILLVPGALLFPDNIIIAKAITLIFGTATLFIFFLWLRKRVGKNHALLGTLLLALNPLMTIFSTQILSDVPFALCLILYFIYAEKICGENKNIDWHEYILVALIVAGVFLREVGTTLILSGAVFFLLKKQYKRAALVFFIPCLFYLIWFIRNEVIIADIEHPAMRNSHIFFSHYYTTNQVSLLTEFFARLSTNLGVYKNSFLKLIFTSGYSQFSLSLVNRNDLFMSLVLRSLPIGQFICYAATLILCNIGIWQELKNPKTLSILSIFLVCYLIPIIFYPINDVRFLFPVLLVMIYFWIIGLKYLYEWWSSFGRAIIKRLCTLCFFLFLLIPSIAWLQSYLPINYHYSQSPAKLYDQIKNEPKNPEQYVKPFYIAGQWIVQHSEPSAVVACRWKELTFSLKGRKLIEVQPQFTPDDFDNMVRDYGVSYVVAVISRSGLSELESVIDRAQKASFSLVYRVGDVEVLEVKRVETFKTNNLRPAISDSSNRTMFRYALKIIENNPAEAEQVLWKLKEKTNNYSEVTFQIGVAKEFKGNLDSANSIFEGFRLMSQALSYVYQSWNHLEMIAKLKNAMNAYPLYERAHIYNNLGLDYWNMGYQTEAMKMLKQSLEIDSMNFSARIFLTIFSLQIKDTISAQKYLKMAETLHQNNMLVKQMEIILKSQDSLKMILSPAQQVEIRMKNVEAYTTMGMREIAIDELLIIIEKNPENPEAFKLLAQLYEFKERYSLALKCYQHFKTLDPNNASVNRIIQELSSRF